jgi:hypothetical protein
MSTNPIYQVIDGMDPEEALASLSMAVRQLFSLLGEEARLKFVVNLLGDAGDDQVASMVHL